MRRLTHIALIICVLVGWVLVVAASATPTRADRGLWAPNKAGAAAGTSIATASPIRTSTRTPTNGGPTLTRTRTSTIIIITITRTRTPTPTPTTCVVTTWDPNITYNVGACVSYNGHVYITYLSTKGVEPPNPPWQLWY
jgi:hypothetical protein